MSNNSNHNNNNNNNNNTTTNDNFPTAANSQQLKQRINNDQMSPTSSSSRPSIQIETFNSFPVNQVQQFNVLLPNSVIKQNDLVCNIENPILGALDKQIEWLQADRCRISFRALIVGIYTINVELLNQQTICSSQFQAKAYDLSKVFILNSSGKCSLNESYEFSVDASEAGEGQLEIAVNEGEIPNQVQVLDNGRCIVNFVPEDCVPHIVDIKFNGENVNGCPFVVEVTNSIDNNYQAHTNNNNNHHTNGVVDQPPSNESTSDMVLEQQQQQQVSENIAPPIGKPTLSKEERTLVNTPASFCIYNIKLENKFDKDDLVIVDPENQQIPYKLVEDLKHFRYEFEFTPTIVGDYTVELKQKCELYEKLLHQQSKLIEQFPFPIKVFDFTKVIVSDVTDGIIGHPIFFFIDASQAGSGNLEIRVHSKTRNVPNHHQSEANAKIRVNFTPTEPVDHSIDVRFNGIPVPGNPFLVKVAQFPQARLPVSSQDLLKYVAINENVSFYVDYIGTKENRNLSSEELNEKSCQAHVLGPDYVYTKLPLIELVRQQQSATSNEKLAKWRVEFKPTKIGPYKLFITVNNELLPSSPVISHVYNIREVKVYFDKNVEPSSSSSSVPSTSTNKVIGQVKKPFTFTVDASMAGEGILALAVVSSVSTSPVQIDVKPSDKRQGLYYLTFVPLDFAPHSIDMSFNNRQVPSSPFLVDILDANGQLYSEHKREQNNVKTQQQNNNNNNNDAPIKNDQLAQNQQQQQQMVQNFEALSLKRNSNQSKAPSSVSSKSSSTQLHNNNNNNNGSTNGTSNNKKSIASGLVNASNIVYLESSMLDSISSKNHSQLNHAVNLLGPNGKQVPFVIGKGSPQSGEPKKPYIEYKPKCIGTHTISVLDGGREVYKYYVEICDPSLVEITDLQRTAKGKFEFIVGKPVKFCIDSSKAGQIQLDTVTILGPSSTSNSSSSKSHSKSSASSSSSKNGDHNTSHTNIFSRLKSISGSTSSSSNSTSCMQQNNYVVDYTLTRLSDHKQEIQFIPQLTGKYSVDVRCLGQSVGMSPFELEILSSSSSSGGEQQSAPLEATTNNLNSNKHENLMANEQKLDTASTSSSSKTYASSSTNKGGLSNGKLQPPSGSGSSNQLQLSSRDDELLQNIIVHGISLKCSPVNSTGAFIIETNRMAHARDFDVLITDPNNSLVDVQCYLQQDGNLLAEWTPRRVGTHKIEVLFKDRQVPGSPFITEAFDPSGVIIKDVKSTVYLVNDKIEFKIDRKEAGLNELDVTITSPVGNDLPIDIRSLEEQQAGEVGELISFTPTVAGKYKMSVSFGGFEVPKSPITFIARHSGDQGTKLSGAGLKGAEVNRSAQFIVENGSSEGELKVRIECGNREIVPKVERRSNVYTVKYKPIEVGYASVSVYWNGVHVDASPFTIPVNDLSKILFLSGTNKSSNTNNQRIIHYEPNIEKEITVDTSKCGPGELKAEAYCRANPNIKWSLPIQQYSSSRYKLVFCCPPPKEVVGAQLSKGITINLKEISYEATYLIRFYYNNLFVPEALASVVVSPIFASSTTNSNNNKQLQQQQLQPSNTQRSTLERNNNNNNNAQAIGSKILSQQQQQLSYNNNNNHSPNTAQLVGSVNDQVDCPIVALRGHGLVEAVCGEKAEFTIDGSKAGPGKPEVRFSGVQTTEELKLVRLDQIGDENIYKATYIAQVVGVYSLNVLWDGKQVAGCPVSINVTGGCDASKVLCTGEGLKGGVIGEEIKTFIDTRRAGPGELTAICTGPQKVAFCELLDRGDGTFILYIKPQEPGRQFLTVKYGGQHIPKSPFLIKISGKPDASKVRVYGPGVEHGVLSLYQSRFVCDTRGAGAGQLTVRIRGPKGAFRMETQRESQRDRTILCKYDPTEPGDYRIEIKWSGHHVPGSPFSVMIFDTQEELNRYIYL